MSKLIFEKQNLLDAFPYALVRDNDKAIVADVIAEQLVKMLACTDLPTILPNVDKLDEAMLDILAADFKVDWYIYEGSIRSKRAQIKSCFFIHRHLGTKFALETALSDVYPDTSIQEWFEYEGKPYHFTLVLDVSHPRVPVAQDIIERIVYAIKPVRSVFEGNGITYRVRHTIVIGCRSGYKFFTARICGTHPHPSVTGDIENFTITVGAVWGKLGYKMPTVKTLNGTFPMAAFRGKNTEDCLRVSEKSVKADYISPTVKTNNGTYPSARTRGAIGNGDVGVETKTESGVYSAPANGTKPEYSRTGNIGGDGITAQSSGDNANFAAAETGVKPYASKTGEIYGDGISAKTETGNTNYTAAETGVKPHASVSGELSGDEFFVQSLADSADFQSEINGTGVTGAKPYASASGELSSGGIAAQSSAKSSAFQSELNGTVPDVTVGGVDSGGGIDFGTDGGAAIPSTRNCGTPFGNLM